MMPANPQVTDEMVETAARELHRHKCNSAGIMDDDKISEYWLGCNRSMYRIRAIISAAPLPQKEG